MTSAQLTRLVALLLDREAIRNELEQTREDYHQLLRSLSDADWKTRSGNPAWKVGQLMRHLAWGAGYFPKGVEECRRGKAMNPPTWLMNPLNMVITRVGSRGATPASVAEKYDEWHKGVKPLGAFGVYKTVESVFRVSPPIFANMSGIF